MLEKCWKSGDKVLHNQHSLKILQNLDANCPPHFIHLTRPGCRGFDLELMPYQARIWDIDQIGTKFVFVYLRLCICWPLMCIWWNMSTDFRVITTPLLSMCTRFLRSNLHKQCNLCYLYQLWHSTFTICTICSNCCVLFVRFVRFAALTLGLSTVSHSKLSIQLAFLTPSCIFWTFCGRPNSQLLLK